MPDIDTTEITDPRIRLDRLENKPWWIQHGAWLSTLALALIGGGIAWGLLSAGQEDTATTVRDHGLKIEKLDREQSAQATDIRWVKATLERVERKLDRALRARHRDDGQ